MVVGFGLDIASLTPVLSSGIGRIVAALAVVAIAYVLAAAAISLMRPDSGRERLDDLAGLVLVVTLAAYLLSSWLLDAVWFEMISAALVGLATVALLLAEAKALAARLRMHGH